MAHDHLVNRLFFQIIGTVDFSRPITVGRIIDDLRGSGIVKVLLVVQGDNIEAVMREVRMCFVGLILKSAASLSRNFSAEDLDNDGQELENLHYTIEK